MRRGGPFQESEESLKYAGKVTLNKAAGADLLALQLGLSLQSKFTTVTGGGTNWQNGNNADQVITPTGADLKLAVTTGIGDGANGNVQAPAKGTGTGPTTMTVSTWLRCKKADGTQGWVPFFV